MHLSFDATDPIGRRSEPEDARLTVEALRRHRPETLGDLLEAYGREIQAVAYLIVRDHAESEDIVVETLLTAFERGGSIRDERALRAWLLRVATNHALQRRRRSARIVPIDVVSDRAGGDVLAQSPDRVALLAGIGELPAQMRAAIVLRYYADLSVEDVAAALGKSPNTIKAQLQTALDRLRTHLAEPIGTSLGEAPNHA